MKKWICINRLLYIPIIFIMLSGCSILGSGKNLFEDERNYDIGRSVDLSYAMPAEHISSYNENQDKYLFKQGGCQWVYYVNKNTKVVESWEYVSSPDKCSMGLDWFGIW